MTIFGTRCLFFTFLLAYSPHIRSYPSPRAGTNNSLNKGPWRFWQIFSLNYGPPVNQSTYYSSTTKLVFYFVSIIHDIPKCWNTTYLLKTDRIYLFLNNYILTS